MDAPEDHIASEDHIAWVRLGLAQGQQRPWARSLVNALGGPRAAADADPSQLAKRLPAGRAREVARALRHARPEALIRRAEELGQQVLTPVSSAWPKAAFTGIDDAPCLLFLRGRLPAEGDPTVAIVGTRDASPYGLRVARDLAGGLGRGGVWVVSGFALGIDGAAHDATVAVGASTLAVLGCGLDHAYPVAHCDLKEALVKQGGLVSEHPPGTEPRRHYFPRRNRLVAAFSRVVVVVEAAARSGALITARLALDLGREILAVPGGIYRPNHAGCFQLLEQGAGLCVGVDSILAALGLEPGGQRSLDLRAAPDSGPEALLWRSLDEEDALDAGELCRRTGLSAEDVAIGLTELEMQGRARRLPGVGFLRS